MYLGIDPGASGIEASPLEAALKSGPHQSRRKRLAHLGDLELFLVTGEALVDLVTEPDGRLTPVEGGAPYNFARALSLQSLDVGYLNPLSLDAFGERLSRTLADSGAEHLGGRSSAPTSLALVSFGASGAPSYSFYRDRVADRDMDLDRQLADIAASVAGFHTGGLALVPPDDRQILSAIRGFRSRGILCTVDINMRPQFARSTGIDVGKYRDAALAAAGSAHVVKVSDDDLHHLGFAGEPRVAARALLHHGCRLAVLTLGASGAWAITAETEVFEEAQPVAPVDTVGAGDCFFAGFIASLHRQRILDGVREAGPPANALRTALRHASVCAAINVGRKGCAPPTWEEAAAWRPRS